eukprot:11983857-Heterocapsa_arctica.AAC.1
MRPDACDLRDASGWSSGSLAADNWRWCAEIRPLGCSTNRLDLMKLRAVLNIYIAFWPSRLVDNNWAQ